MKSVKSEKPIHNPLSSLNTLDYTHFYLNCSDSKLSQIYVKLSSYDRALMFLSFDFLARDVGSRLPGVIDYSEKIGIGTGTVQKAMKYLESEHAVSIRARGHLGSFITSLSTNVLWRFTRCDAIRITLGPDEAPEFSGLEHGLIDALAALGVTAVIRHMRGSSARAEALHRGAQDCALFSQMACSHYFGSNDFGTTALALGTNTYYRENSITVLERADTPKRGRILVGVDTDSIDHQHLTRLHFSSSKGRFDYVECPYSHILAALLSGRIHTAVWHKVLTIIPLAALPIRQIPVHSVAANRIRNELSVAYLVHDGRNPAISHIMRRLNFRLLQEKQRQKMDLLDQRHAKLEAYFR